jgi:hypothetical protein
VHAMTVVRENVNGGEGQCLAWLYDKLGMEVPDPGGLANEQDGDDTEQRQPPPSPSDDSSHHHDAMPLRSEKLTTPPADWRLDHWTHRHTITIRGHHS